MQQQLLQGHTCTHHKNPFCLAVFSTLLVQTGNVGDVKAAALDVSSPLSCVALFVGGGSSIETEETAGASKLLEYMAFSATNAR
jgi:hypothetical protein